jgi:chromosome segregation ATPase
MFEIITFLKSHTTSIISFLTGSGVIGAGVKIYNTYLKSDQQEYDQDQGLITRLSERLDKVEERLQEREKEISSLREEQSKLRQDLNDAEEKISRKEIIEDKLISAIDQLIYRVDRLLERLSKYESISDEERSDYLSLPPYIKEIIQDDN